jgi:hypothetical protein
VLSDKLGSETDPEKKELIEIKLTRLNEQNIRDKLIHSNLFNILNNEKMTPTFLRMAKISKNSGSMSEIKDATGIPFESEKDRRDFVLSIKKFMVTRDPQLP